MGEPLRPEETAAFRALEARLRQQGLRGHIYLIDSQTSISFATTADGTSRRPQTNHGPDPIEAAWKEITGKGYQRPNVERLTKAAGADAPVPGAVWNTPHLVVTGVSAAHALVMAARHAADHGRETMHRLTKLAGASGMDEIAEWYKDAHVEDLPWARRYELRYILSLRPKKLTREHEYDEPEPLLTQGRAHELLGRLSEKMPALQEPADIYVIGGAAMMFEYDAGRQTEDIDCVIRSYRPEVLEAAEQVAREEPGLGPDWLNEEADKFGSVPESPDPDERTSYSGARIHVASAGPDRLLAMKLSSNRQKDAQDIGRLLKITGTKSLGDAKQLYSEAFGNEPMGEDAEKLVEALLTDPDRAATRPSEAQRARARNEPEQQRLVGTGGDPTR